MLREFKKKPPEVKWAWAVAVTLAILLVAGIGYGLFSLITWLTG